MALTREQLINLLSNYDFNKNSVSAFCKTYRISRNTATKYLRENNIKCTRLNGVINMPNRDVHGRFLLGAVGTPPYHARAEIVRASPKGEHTKAATKRSEGPPSAG